MRFVKIGLIFLFVAYVAYNPICYAGLEIPDPVKQQEMNLQWCADAVKREPNSAENWCRWGDVLVNYGREEPDLIKKRALLEEARKKAEKATQCDAKYTEAWMVWGHAFFNLSESESDPNKKREELVEAAAKYKEAARLKPNYTNARYNWGCMSERLAVLEGDVKKKQALLEVAQDKYLGVEKDAHGFEWCLFDRARVAVLRGNKEEGRAMLEKSKLNLTIDVKDMQTNPAWDSVRAEAWFQALLK